MSTLTRKQQEMDQREQQVLQLARSILLEEGYSSLNMERLAAEMRFAKGTLYNHFPNKEEIVVALAIQSMELRRKIFERASVSFPGSRQRMSAIGCACDVYASHYSDHFSIEEMLRNGSILERTSERRQNLVRQCEHRIMSIVSGVVRDAIASGDLTLPQNMTAEELVFGFWSLMYGSRILMATSPSLSDIGVVQPQRSIRRHGWTLMNGYRWMPFIEFEEAEQMMNELENKLCDYDY